MDLSGEFDSTASACRSVFTEKFVEYGPSWRLMRLATLCDRIFSKAARIRRLEQLGGTGKVPDSIESEFIGIANYSVMILDRLEHEGLVEPVLSDLIPPRWTDPTSAENVYASIAGRAKALIIDKDHDYNGAWRSIRDSTFTDEVITRILRVHELLNSDSPDLEVVYSQILDCFNYCILFLIRKSRTETGS